MKKFIEYLIEEDTIRLSQIPNHIKTKAFNQMLASTRNNKNLVLLVHMTDLGHEAELLNLATSHDKELMKHRIRGGAKIVDNK